MITNILSILFIFIVPALSCRPLPASTSSPEDVNTRFTITNKTSDIDVQVVLGSSSVVLEKDDCVQSSFGDLAQIQAALSLL